RGHCGAEQVRAQIQWCRGEALMAKSTPAQRFARIFELFLNGATPGERDAAERKVNAWLKQHGKTRADIKAILAQAAVDDAAQAPPPPPSDPRAAPPPHPLDPPLPL